MTHRIRDLPLSQEISKASSLEDSSKYKHHRKIHQRNMYYDDDDNDYTEASQSQSQDEYEDEEDDEEEYASNKNTSYGESESIHNAPSDQVSLPGRPKSILESTSNNFHPQSPLTSASIPTNPLHPLPQIASYINVAPLPVFHGNSDECPITHLSRFTKVCRANNVSSIEMMTRIFPVTLDKEAALWYDLNVEPYPSLNWEEIKCSFLEAYHKNRLADQLRSELMMINQGAEESVRSYFLRFQWILKKWPEHGLPDGLLKGIFIDGLTEDFQDWIIPQKPNSLDEALRLAFNLEQVKSIRASRHKDYKCGFCDDSHEERVCEIRERMKQLWIKSKEKGLKVSLVRSESNAAVKELVRSVSGGSSDVVGKQDVEDEKEEGGVLGGKKSSQCQCWKHQCGKKNLVRNNSLVTRNSNAG